tara:strand:+ start:8545 stop:8937 length:393 start_codon:yes stop_codon:yes gene_type:complete
MLNLKSILFENFTYKILALFIAIILWLFIIGRDDMQESAQIPIDIKVPQNYVLKRMDPDQADVVFRGNPKLIRRYLRSKPRIQYVIYNTKNPFLRLEIREDKLDLPFGVNLISIQPRYLNIEIREADENG